MPISDVYADACPRLIFAAGATLVNERADRFSHLSGGEMGRSAAMQTRSVKYMALVVSAAALSSGAFPGAAADAASSAAPTSQAERTARPAGPHADTIAPAASANWNGRYVYEFDGSRAAGGHAAIVTYALAIDNGQCLLDVIGFQARESIVCTAKAGRTMIDILFKSYANGRTIDARGNAVYSVGDPLFALERDGNALLTRWKGYPAPGEKPVRPAILFRRQ